MTMVQKNYLFPVLWLFHTPPDSKYVLADCWIHSIATLLANCPELQQLLNIKDFTSVVSSNYETSYDSDYSNRVAW